MKNLLKIKEIYPNIQNQGCGVGSGVDVFGWSRSQIPKNTRSRSWILYPTPTPEVELNYFLDRTLKVRNPNLYLLRFYNIFRNFIERESSCCAPRFPLIASCYKIVDSQTSFTLCEGVGSRKFWKGRKIMEARGRIRIFYFRLRNPVQNYLVLFKTFKFRCSL